MENLVFQESEQNISCHQTALIDGGSKNECCSVTLGVSLLKKKLVFVQCTHQVTSLSGTPYKIIPGTLYLSERQLQCSMPFEVPF